MLASAINLKLFPVRVWRSRARPAWLDVPRCVVMRKLVVPNQQIKTTSANAIQTQTLIA